MEVEVRRAGFMLYHWSLKPAGRRRILKVFLHSEEGVNLDDCARVSRRLGVVLEEEEAIEGSFVLEVSSPGLDRMLLQPWHYEISCGQRVRLVLNLESEGSRSLEGVLLGLESGDVLLRVDDREERFPLAAISKARVLPDLSLRKVAENSDGGKR